MRLLLRERSLSFGCLGSEKLIQQQKPRQEPAPLLRGVTNLAKGWGFSQSRLILMSLAHLLKTLGKKEGGNSTSVVEGIKPEARIWV